MTSRSTAVNGVISWESLIATPATISSIALQRSSRGNDQTSIFVAKYHVKMLIFVSDIFNGQQIKGKIEFIT